MRRTTCFSFAAVFVAALTTLLVVTLVQAQGPEPPVLPTPVEAGEERPLASQAAVGTGFTYQGRLEDATGPFSGTCAHLQFNLYEDVSGISLVGGPIYYDNRQMVDGYFVVSLDFGTSAFQGEKRYLEIAVDCDDTGFEFLTPLVELSAAPYALGLRPGTVVRGEVTAGAAFYADNSYSGAFSSYGVHGKSSNDIGVYGEGNTGVYGIGTTYGVDADGATAIRGQGSTTGVLGEGGSVGVQGESSSSSGRGVFGYASSSSGATYGVLGMTDSSSNDAAGVRGTAGGSNGVVYGVYGYNSSYTSGAAGVRGDAGQYDGQVYGVYGYNNTWDSSSARDSGLAGAGVYGYGAFHGDGVRGYSQYGYGVFSDGDAHIDGDLTWFTRTGYLSVPAAAFIPIASGNPYTVTGARLICDDPLNFSFVAPLNLPHKATISDLTFYWADASGGDHQLWLQRADLMGNSINMATVSSYNASPGSSSPTSISNPVIYNSMYTYNLYLHHAGLLSGVYGVVIEYKYTEPY